MISLWTEEKFSIILIIIAAMMLSVFLILTVIIFMRRTKIANEKKRDQFVSSWMPLMAQALEGKLRIWPEIPKEHYIDFLLLWNQFQANLSGDAKQALNHMAKALGMEQVAVNLLSSRLESERALAALTLGHLQSQEAGEAIKQIALASTGLSGQVAALSLARIDPKEFAPVLVPLFARRRQWPQTIIASILEQLGPVNVSEPLIEIIEQATESDLPRLIASLAFIDSNRAADLLKRILLQTNDVEVIAACLKQTRHFGDQTWIRLIKPFSSHSSWIVRVQAVNALGRLASEDQLPELICMLGDENWWVRYRSAQAITNLPFMDQTRLMAIINNQSDQYAADMLTQVMAEKKMELEQCY